MAARPAPSGVVHQLGHPLDEPAELVVEVLDVVRFHAQHGIRVLADLGERERRRATASGSGSRSTSSPFLGVRVDKLLVALVGHGASVLTASSANPCQKPCGSTSTTPSVPRPHRGRRGREQLPEASCDEPRRIRLRDQLGAVAAAEPRQRCRPDIAVAGSPVAQLLERARRGGRRPAR